MMRTARIVTNHRRRIECIYPRLFNGLNGRNQPSATTRPFSSSTDLVCTATSAASTHVPIEPMSWYNLSQYVMDWVHLTHDMTGLSYAASIVVVTTICRGALFPLAIVSRKNASRKEALEPKLKHLRSQIPNGKRRRQAMRELFLRYNYKPHYHFSLPIISIAGTMYMWYGLRWMGYYYPDDMVMGGVLWFVNLTEPDPINFLPIVSASSFLLMGELGADNLGRPSGELSTRQRWFWRSFRLCLFPVLMGIPAAVQCFWIPNSILSMVQTVVLSQPSFMRRVGIYHEAHKADEPIVFLNDLVKTDETTPPPQKNGDSEGGGARKPMSTKRFKKKKDNKRK